MLVGRVVQVEMQQIKNVRFSVHQRVLRTVQLVQCATFWGEKQTDNKRNYVCVKTVVRVQFAKTSF